MPIEELISLTKKQFEKQNKDSEMQFLYAKDEPPASGLVIDNPQLEYILDRRFLAYGRCYLFYGKKGASKTSLFLDIAKAFQKQGGDVIWIETEHAIDLDFAKKQGVNLDKLVLLHPSSLEEALSLAEQIVRNMPKAYPDGNTPVLICLDSIAGSVTEYEVDTSHSVRDVKPGEHARLLSRFYREFERPLAKERCIFLALNQLKVSIGGFGGFGEEPPESMIGGEAPRFHSTYQLKIVRTKDLTYETDKHEKIKIGSRHQITCKRNKLGKEGNSQNVEFDLYIDGGIDWYGPLVRRTAKFYPEVISSGGAGWYNWNVPNIHYTTGEGGNELISTEDNYREPDLARLISSSPEAKEVIRKCLKIPDLPPEKVIAQLEVARLSKRKTKKSLEEEPGVSRLVEEDPSE